MKDFAVDVCGNNFCKHNEDTCGDAYKVFQGSDSTVVVLSDGLGSGVKANVLATLTVEIVGGLMRGNLSTHEVVETLISSLPVCKWRGIAYSTFSILRIYDQGQAILVEYDSPYSFQIKGEENIRIIHGTPINVLGKNIRESHFKLNPGDMIMQITDGIIHAGVGATLRMGWQEEGVHSYLKHVAPLADGNPSKLAKYITSQASDLWLDNSGDDGTVVVTKYRKAINAVIMTGPPGNREDTPKMVDKFLSHNAVKISCGGTTSHILADRLGSSVDIDYRYLDSGLPPIARIKGLDLVTEGMLTLNKAVEYLKNGIPKNTDDAATRLLEICLACDGITFMLGTARNAAHQNANFPAELLLRRGVVEALAGLLATKGRLVEVEYY